MTSRLKSEILYSIDKFYIYIYIFYAHLIADLFGKMSGNYAATESIIMNTHSKPQFQHFQSFESLIFQTV